MAHIDAHLNAEIILVVTDSVVVRYKLPLPSYCRYHLLWTRRWTRLTTTNLLCNSTALMGESNLRMWPFYRMRTWECPFLHRMRTWECPFYWVRNWSFHGMRTWECPFYWMRTWECPAFYWVRNWSFHGMRTWECPCWMRTWECPFYGTRTWETDHSTGWELENAHSTGSELQNVNSTGYGLEKLAALRDKTSTG